MKVGFLGDVHANLEALDKSLKALRSYGCKFIIATGDIVGYGPQPKECIERIANMGIHSVLGNHDEYTLDDGPLWTINDEARYVIEWTRKQLDKPHLEWLSSLPDVLDADVFTVIHASNATSPRWAYVIDDRSAVSNFKKQTANICFNGHTHIPILATDNQDGEPDLELLEDCKLKEGKKYLVNVGSVGQPRDKDPRAACVAFNTETLELKVIRVEYDLKKTQDVMKKHCFPEKLITRLEIGR